MRNALIIGANFLNKGAEAMLLTVRDQLNKRGQYNLYMLCKPYEADLASQVGLKPIYDSRSQNIINLSNFVRAVKGKILKMATGKNRHWLEIIPINSILATKVAFDIVIDISGFAYGDNWGAGQIEQTVRLVKKIRHKGLKVVFLPQAWGPFEKDEVQKAFQRLYDEANKLYVRDEKSLQYVSDALTSIDKVSLMHDIVFAFEQEKTPIIDNTKRTGNLRIGFSPNMRMYQKEENSGNGIYLDIFIEAIKYAIDNFGAEVVLLSNEIKPIETGFKDDNFLCELILEKMPEVYRQNITHKKGYQSALEVHETIGELDFLIGSRFHGLIFALSQSVPCIALSWSHKYQELFKLFDLSEYVIADSEMSSEGLIQLMENLMRKREIISTTLTKKSKQLKSDIYAIFDHF